MKLACNKREKALSKCYTVYHYDSPKHIYGDSDSYLFMRAEELYSVTLH